MLHLGEVEQCGLRRAVGADAGPAFIGSHGNDVDDTATARLAHAHADSAETVPTRPILSSLVASGIAGIVVQFRDQAAKGRRVDRLRFRGIEELRLAAPGLDRGGRQIAPGLDVSVTWRGEAGGFLAVHLQA